jgi:hypothetical protein
LGRFLAIFQTFSAAGTPPEDRENQSGRKKQGFLSDF